MLATLVQIDGWDPLAAASVTLRAGSHDDPTLCMLNGYVWWPALAKLPALQYDLFDGAFAGQLQAPSTSLSLITEPWPLFGRYQIADARVRIWTGNVGDVWTSFTLRFDGRAGNQPKLSDGKADLDIGVDDRWLDAPLLATYAGTTGTEGSSDLTGQPKPLALGAPRYVGGTLIDSVNSVFQVSAYGVVQGFEAALERLARFSASVANYTSYVALASATIAPGMWATCKAQGLARFGAPPAGQISFLLQGDAAGSDGWARKPGQLIRRIAILSGGTGKINDASLSALDTARPWNLSVNISRQTTAREMIQSIAASVNATAGVSWTGELFVTPVSFGTPSVALAADGGSVPPVASVAQENSGPPWWRLAIQAQRCWTVHALNDIAFEATLTPRGQYSATTTYREGDIVTQSDGSEYLYISTTPTAGSALPVAPATANTWWDELQVATTAGDIAYVDGQTLQDLQPAEPGATYGATLGTNLKHFDNSIVVPAEVLNSAIDLTPDGRLLAALDGVTQTELGRLALPDLGAASDASRRQLEAAVDQLGQGLLRAAIENSTTRATLRDAGITVDPTSGVVRIYGVDYNAERLNDVQIRVSAAEGSILLRATTAYVDNAVATAVINPSQVAALGTIQSRLTTVEVSIDSINGTLSLKADSTIVGTLAGRVTTVEAGLDAATGTLSLKANSTTVSAIDARLSTAESTLTALPDSATLSSGVTAARYAQAGADAAADGALRALLTGDEASRARLQQIADARQELTAKINDDGSAEASARIALATRVGTAEAGLVTEGLVRADAYNALSALISALTATVSGNTAAISAETSARASADGTMAAQITTLNTNYGTLAASVSAETVARTNADSAIAGTVTTLNTTVANHSATLTSHQSSIDGLNLKWGVEFDIGGRITGFVLNGGSSRTDASFVVDSFKIVKAGAAPRTVFAIGDDGNTYVLGKLLANSIETEWLKVNTAVVPVRASGTSYVPGAYTSTSGTANPRTNVLTAVVHMPVAGWIEVAGKLAQGFTSDAPWFLAIAVNGDEIAESYTGGGKAQDSIATQASFYAPTAGDYTVTLRWAGHTSVTARERSMFVKGFPKTE